MLTKGENENIKSDYVKNQPLENYELLSAEVRKYEEQTHDLSHGVWTMNSVDFKNF